MSKQLFIPLRKSADRIVAGIASAEIVDDQSGYKNGQRWDGDIITSEAIRDALDDFMQWGNLRHMHRDGSDGAAGTVLELLPMDGVLELDGQSIPNPTWIMARVVDDDAWAKVQEGVYKGFSLGGYIAESKLQKIGGRTARVVSKIRLHEISLVDRPANPQARILIQKRSHRMAKQIDPSKAVSLLQGLRNEAELGGNVDAAQLITHAISLVLEASGDAETDDPAEPEGAGDIDTALLAEEAGETEEEPTAKAAGSELRKAGRTFNKGNSSAMHKVIESIAKMLASAGDEVGNKILSMYAPAEPEGMGKAAAADTLRKSLSETLEPLTKSIATLTARLERLERQPAAGGPVLRAPDKQLAGQPATIAAAPELPEASPLVREQLGELLRKSNMAGSAEERARALQTYEILRKQYR